MNCIQLVQVSVQLRFLVNECRQDRDAKIMDVQRGKEAKAWRSLPVHFIATNR